MSVVFELITARSCRLVTFTALSLGLAACGGSVIVESSAPSPEDLPGREVFLDADIRCDGCHTTLGAKATGPTFLGLAGSEVELESGETVIADEAYLRRSIVDPNAQIVAGFAPLMPDFYSETLTTQEIDDLIEYIASLSDVS